MSFCERLKEERKKRGLTSLAMASALGVAPSSYSQYESGKREPDFYKIKAISKILDVSIDFLLFGSESETKTETQTTELIQMFEKLSYNAKEKVIDYTRLIYNSENK